MGNISKTNKDIEKLNEKIRKKKRAEAIKRVKENRIKRKKRAIHLFILGNIFKYAKLDNEEEELLIGYCLSYNKVNPLKFNSYEITGKQILAEKNIKRNEFRENYSSSFHEKKKNEDILLYKKEYSRMIKLGAIFEMTKLDKIKLEILYGFILDLKTKNLYDKNNYLIEGKIFNMKKGKKYNTPSKEKVHQNNV